MLAQQLVCCHLTERGLQVKICPETEPVIVGYSFKTSCDIQLCLFKAFQGYFKKFGEEKK